MKLPTGKEIETDLNRALQQTYSDAFTQVFTELDLVIAEIRDKARFQLKNHFIKKSL